MNSTTLDVALSSETGLYLVLSVFDPLFLNRGITFAIFQLLGKTPLSSELLIMKVSGATIISAADFSILVLTKSTPLDDFDLIDLMAFLTWAFVTGFKVNFRCLPFKCSESLDVGSML